MFDIISPFKFSWYFKAYSIAKRPPHECPNKKKFELLSPSFCLTVSTSSTNLPIVQSDESFDGSLL